MKFQNHILNFERTDGHPLTDKPKALCPFNFFKVGGINIVDLQSASESIWGKLITIQRARPDKKIVFRVTRPYLNLQLKPRFFSVFLFVLLFYVPSQQLWSWRSVHLTTLSFSGKNGILCILKGEMPFKRHKIIFFPEKKIYVPTLPKI